MAGPHVVGLVALIISANPELAGNVDEIQSIIEQSAIQKTSDDGCGDDMAMNIPNNKFGHGRIDALAAVNLALQLTSTENDLEESVNIKVFPNPVSDFVQFELQNFSAKITLEIYTATGQLVRSDILAETGEFQTITIPTNDLSSGVYFYRCLNQDNNFSGKFIKK
jgi:hypothetical protein